MAVAAVLLLAAVLVRVEELFPLAVAAIVLVGVSLLWVRTRPWVLDTERDIRPIRVGAGGTARVELSVRNLGARPSPVVSLKDPFDGGRFAAAFTVAPVAPDEGMRAAYRLPTTQRGVFGLGPLELHISDPFGLARVVRPGAPAAKLTVHPPIERLTAPAVNAGTERESHTGSTVIGLRGDEFYALREYNTGDDLRRVHWASSARTDHLMIRQEQTVRQGRLLLMADLRADVHTPASLEAVLGAMASLADAALRSATYVRVVTTAGHDTGYGTSSVHRGTVMDMLAAASTHPTVPIGPVLTRLGADPGGSMVFVTTDGARVGDVATFGRMGPRAACRAVIMERAPTSGGSSSGRPSSGGLDADWGRVVAVRVPFGTPFAPIWERAVRTPLFPIP